ncbi:MAG: DNA mismatch repair endonuclease MutL [Prevotellaceae bacterium]|nr:DNA mismatch repair endonuclease MutL [Prevotellaceae bacterium]
MADIIHLLPDSVANQIAAGEVVQRPSSVVKELLENSIDAGATNIELWLTDAGKTSIQVVDNGKGMSETDARLSFERHATSKILKADDLFNLSTMGFRGEALASIAAVAQVELRTRTQNDETGVCIVVEGARCIDQFPVQCGVGANFVVRNLFYNVPARRRFLKSNATEFNNIMQEFERVALINPHVSFKLYKDDLLICELRGGSFKQRIVGLFGNALDKQLLPISVDTDIVRIDGFVASPQSAKHKGLKQFLFVNGRYMRHPYFNKAILSAYERLIPQDKQVSFFVEFTVSPSQIDVNIHPTKTEIKFEDDHAIWQMLLMATRDTLAKYNAVPSMDFEGFEEVAIPSFSPDGTKAEPAFSANRRYNPFDAIGKIPDYRLPDDFSSYDFANSTKRDKQLPPQSNNEISSNFMGQPSLDTVPQRDETTVRNNYIQYGARYIVTPVKSGLMIIDYVRAHRRILYDKFMSDIQSGETLSQTLLFPVLIELSHGAAAILESFLERLNTIGFDITSVGGNTYSVSAVPSAAADVDFNAIIMKLVDDYDKQGLTEIDLYHNLALSVSRSNSLRENHKMESSEMTSIVDRLFACQMPNIGPDGKRIISILTNEMVTKEF